jgi:hypothetical protein
MLRVAGQTPPTGTSVMDELEKKLPGMMPFSYNTTTRPDLPMITSIFTVTSR